LSLLKTKWPGKYSDVVRNAVRESSILHNKGIHELNTSPTIVRLVRPKRLWWAGHVARVGKTRNA
jgi:hypothetical protein